MQSVRDKKENGEGIWREGACCSNITATIGVKQVRAGMAASLAFGQKVRRKGFKRDKLSCTRERFCAGEGRPRIKTLGRREEGAYQTYQSRTQAWVRLPGAGEG